ncbi:hypothetical protein Hanom_Chr05g00410461 [Helianthus anomalus]
MKFQQIDEDSDLLVPISSFYWPYFIPNFSSLSSSFLRRAISIFKRLLIGLLRSMEKSCNGEEVQLRLYLRSLNPNTIQLLDLVCLYAGWGILNRICVIFQRLPGGCGCKMVAMTQIYRLVARSTV